MRGLDKIAVLPISALFRCADSNHIGEMLLLARTKSILSHAAFVLRERELQCHGWSGA